MQIDLMEGPPLLCGRLRPDYGINNVVRFPLPCVRSLGHEGDVHRDRLRQEWTALARFVPLVRHRETVQQLVRLELRALALLDELAQESCALGLPTTYRASVQQERQHARRSLIGMGLMMQGVDL